MTLLKRVPRSLKENLSFYASTSLLTIVSLMLFYLFYISGLGINNFGNEFFSSQCLEDANFTTYLPIGEDELADLEAEYDVTLEAQISLDLVEDVIEDDTTIRLFKANEKIDLYDITEGRDLAADDEIIISEGYAINMGVELGDTITIQGSAYTVVGYFQRPDYLYMLQETDDSYKNISTFFLAYVTDDVFDSLGTGTTTYLVRYNEANDKEFRTAVNEAYHLQSYLSADDNVRITMVHEQADMFIAAGYVILVLMPLLTVVLIAIMISRKIKEEQHLIGTLSAFGYSKGRLATLYAGFAAIPGILGGALAFGITSAISQPYGELCLSDYEPMRATFYLPVAIGLLGVLVPTVMYVIAAVITTFWVLRCDTVDLLSNRAGGKEHFKKILRQSKLGFSTKYALRSLLGNPSRAFAVTLGVFMGSVIILTCFGFRDSVDHISDSTIDTMGTFEYEYVFNTLYSVDAEDAADHLTEAGSPMLISNFQTDDGTTITFMGLTDDNPYLGLILDDGTAITDLDGYYLSTVAALLLDVEAGDELTFYNPLTLETHTLTIAGIADYDLSFALFTSLDNVAELLDLDAGTYNAVMSDTAIDYSDDIIRTTVRKSSILEQCDTIISQMDVMVTTFILLGILICMASVYAVVQMLIKENQATISMLKILGYTDGEINKIVFRANHFMLPLGILLSIPAAYAATDAFFMMFVYYGVMWIHTYISPTSFALDIVIVSLCYFGSVFLVGRKTKSVSMEETLKRNRE